MCRSLLCLVAVLSLTGLAQAVSVTPIDDFESYFDSSSAVGGLHEPGVGWTDNAPPVTQSFLMSSGAQGYQAMDVDYAVPGGWAQPDNPTNYDKLPNSGSSRQFAPIDWAPDGAVKMSVMAETGWDISKVNYLLIEWTGTDRGMDQTWIPGPRYLEGWQWMDAAFIPAVILPAGYNTSGWFGTYAQAVRDGIAAGTIAVISPDAGWVDVTITNMMGVGWFGQDLSSFNALTGIGLQLWSGWTDDTGASGGPKINGTATVWPTGPLEGSIDFDNIRYEVPEPATIAMLGLGGLALIRRKK